MSKFFSVVAVVVVAFSAFSAHASINSVVAGCAGGGNCVALVQAEIASYGGSASQRDRAIANLVAALAGVANGSNGRAIGGAIAYAGAQSSSRGQQQQISEIANTIGSGATQTATAAIAGQQGSGN